MSSRLVACLLHKIPTGIYFLIFAPRLDPIQYNILILEFEHVTCSLPFNMARAQSGGVEEVTFPSIWSFN